MENTATRVALASNAPTLTTHLFEVEELEQRLENSWTESLSGSSDGTVTGKVEHTSDGLFGN